MPYDKNSLNIGIGLNQVDNLKPSDYFHKAIADSKSYTEAEEKLQTYYKAQDSNNKHTQQTKECDIVATRIAQILDENDFVFSPIMLQNIHKRLFANVFEGEKNNLVGVFRNCNIAKKEEILGGDSVVYGDHRETLEYLAYDFSLEAKNDYKNIPQNEWSKKIAKFISNIWQIHPFIEGNTRTIAIFGIKYLRQKGVKCHNEIFAEHSLYFRNALVLANYSNINMGITSNPTYLESFFHKLMIDDKAKLKDMKAIDMGQTQNKHHTNIKTNTISKHRGKH